MDFTCTRCHYLNLRMFNFFFILELYILTHINNLHKILKCLKYFWEFLKFYIKQFILPVDLYIVLKLRKQKNNFRVIGSYNIPIIIFFKERKNTKSRNAVALVLSNFQFSFLRKAYRIGVLCNFIGNGAICFHTRLKGVFSLNDNNRSLFFSTVSCILCMKCNQLCSVHKWFMVETIKNS